MQLLLRAITYKFRISKLFSKKFKNRQIVFSKIAIQPTVLTACLHLLNLNTLGLEPQ